MANVPHAAEVVNAAYASDVGVDNDPIDADGGYIWYAVADIAKAHERTLDEVKAQVAQRWRDDEIASRLKTKADDILGKLKAGEAFDTLAAADKLKIETATDLKRGGASGAITPRMTEAIFHTAKDAYGDSVGDVPTQWVVFRVTDIKTPSLDAEFARRQDRRADGAAANGRRRDRPIYGVARDRSWHQHQRRGAGAGHGQSSACGNSGGNPLDSN